MPHVVLAKF